MTILNTLKKTGIEIFISYHPIILKFKREAKELHKQLKNQKISLMQCQEIIVKRNGFNNWHHLIQELKKIYQEDLDNCPLEVSQDIQINNSYILGYDKIFNNYKYQSLDSSLTHKLFVGKDVVGNYDEFIAKQSIRMEQPVLFVSNKDKSGSLDNLVGYANKIGRENDIKIISTEHYHLENNFNYFSSSSLMSLFYNLIEDDSMIGKKGNLLSFLSFAFMYMQYKQQNDNQLILSLEKMLEILNSKTYLTDNNLPKHILDSRKINQDSVEFENILRKKIEELIETKLFSFKDKTVPITLNKNKTDIYLISENQNICKIVLLLLKYGMVDEFQRVVVGGVHEQVYKKKKPIYSIFVRNVFLPGFSAIPAQARSLRVSVNISFSEIKNLKDIEIQTLIANTNLKFLSHDCYNEVMESFDNNLKLDSNKYLNEIDSKDYVFITHKGKRYNISNKNIKI